MVDATAMQQYATLPVLLLGAYLVGSTLWPGYEVQGWLGLSLVFAAGCAMGRASVAWRVRRRTAANIVRDDPGGEC